MSIQKKQLSVWHLLLILIKTEDEYQMQLMLANNIKKIQTFD